MTGHMLYANYGPLIELNGRHLMVRGRSLSDIGEIEKQIMFIKGSAYAAMKHVLDNVQEHLRRDVSVELIKIVRHLGMDVSLRERFDWENTIEGQVFVLWQALRDNGVDYQWVLDTVDQLFSQNGNRWFDKWKWMLNLAAVQYPELALTKIRSIQKPKGEQQQAAPRPTSESFLMHALYKHGFTPRDLGGIMDSQISGIASASGLGDDRYAELEELTVLKGEERRQRLRELEKAYEILADNFLAGQAFLAGASRD